MSFTQKENYCIEDLLVIMELLRSSEGCPWDREQTHQSIRKNFIEETYEAVEAIDNGDTALLREELGDVLLQVVFHTQLEKEQGAFDFDDICDGVCKKLVLRHPHIFASAVADTSEQVLEKWEEIKKQEKHQTTFTETLQSVPRVLPALMRSEKVQKRAAKAGFDYPDTRLALQDLYSELEELRAAMDDADADAVEEELGDLLFSAVNVARFLSIDPEHSLTRSCDKFVARFAMVEELAREQSIDMNSAGIDLLNDLWLEAKIKNVKNFGGI